MLEELLLDAATAYEATGFRDAIVVANNLRQVTAPANWQSDQTKPNHQALESCLAASDCHPSAARLADVADNLNWHYSSGMRQRPQQLKGDYCFTAIIGPGSQTLGVESPIESQDFRFGVYLQNPHTFYLSHRHEAVELYLPMSGTALWQKDAEPFELVKSGTLIQHSTYQPHATETGATPMLAFWAWLGNLSMDTYSFVDQ